MMLVVAGLIRQDGRFLVTRRPKGDWMEGFWEFPGGKVEQDEDPRDALQREIFEELNMEVSAAEIEEVLSYRYPDRFVLLLFFWCRVNGGIPKGRLGQEIRWMSLQEMKNVEFLPADRPLLERLWAKFAETDLS